MPPAVAPIGRVGSLSCLQPLLPLGVSLPFLAPRSLRHPHPAHASLAPPRAGRYITLSENLPAALSQSSQGQEQQGLLFATYRYGQVLGRCGQVWAGVGCRGRARERSRRMGLNDRQWQYSRPAVHKLQAAVWASVGSRGGATGVRRGCGLNDVSRCRHQVLP